MSRRKFKKGKMIRSLDEYAKQTLIWDSRVNKVYHAGWCQSWQFRYVENCLNRGFFFTVEPIKEEEDDT